ncbi:peptidyl-prolyl cis-trans isomerase D [Thermonema lapsum]|uniref:Periplasmic chaperone PpiD n=1 Tax=Thermonema lapsum TaxID=28195 RepID=A0A846MQN1_9BACT|nr:peptidylprolyl isomerase [Thermonema lapsum]NIK73682.1 peptidyl-prolyl cis-trans isomerase D [Thermonema lapsum]
MAIISKIRQRAGVAIILIALGLALFLVGGDILQSGGFRGGNDPVVGEIDGKEITYTEFNRYLEPLKANFVMQAGRQPDEQTMQMLREQAWQMIVFEKVYLPEIEKLGLGVGKEELRAMFMGDSLFLHPQVLASFRDSTGKFSRQLVEQYLQFVKQSPQMAAQWRNFEESLKQDRLQTKYRNMMQYSVYATTWEGKREYEAQNSRVEVNYVFVPYTSLPDSVVKVTDADLERYVNQYRERFPAEDAVSLEYVVFEVKPSREDSLALQQELRELAKTLAVAKDDSLLVMRESDTQAQYGWYSPNAIPDGVFSEERPLMKGGIYGPFLQDNRYMLVKVIDVKEDSVEYVRAAHILFRPVSDKAEDKADAKRRAEEVLQKLKAGEDFAKMARIYGSDGTAAKGGDLGWFGRNVMVEPFEKAVFAADKPGLLPSLVETEFGYHIVKITHPKTNKKYKIATVDRTLSPGQGAYNEAYEKAQIFLSEVSNVQDFRKKVEESPTLVLQTAARLTPSARAIAGVNNAREMIRWAFKEETPVGKSPSLFELPEENKVVVAIVTERYSQDKLDINYYRDILTAEVTKEKKGEYILNKMKELKAASKTLNEIATAYGNITVNTATVALNAISIGITGFNPSAVGRAFGLKKAGDRTEPFAAESGVFVMQLVNRQDAAEIADYSQYKKQVAERQKGSVAFFIDQALRKIYEVKDYRAKYF